MSILANHFHGKSRVRLARVWRDADGTQHFVEWTVEILLESSMEKSFLSGDNSGMTATDTCRNNVYFVAKKMTQRCSAEAFAAALAEHMVASYPLVTAAECTVEQKPWDRVSVADGMHQHGFTCTAPAVRMAFAFARRGTATVVSGGLKDMQVLKTTQSGYAGFLRCPLTVLPEVHERMLATSVTATWRYNGVPNTATSDASYNAVVGAFKEKFFGPATKGVFSPAVQTTIYQMGVAALSAAPALSHITIMCPNIHFLPTLPAGIKFENDVFIATSDPHGTIQATVSRDKDVKPRPKL